jgi:hypothetical protein
MLAIFLHRHAIWLLLQFGDGAPRSGQTGHFGNRVAVRQTDGSLQFDEVSGSFERFVSTHVLDLLTLPDRAHLLAEARRLLVVEGYLWQVAPPCARATAVNSAGLLAHRMETVCW